MCVLCQVLCQVACRRAPGIACALVAAALVASSVSCSQTIRYPRFASPGPAPFQRYNATQFDPYPPNDLGPEIVGGRPAGYTKPPNEVIRARQQQPRGPQSSPALLAPVPLTPPAVRPPLY